MKKILTVTITIMSLVTQLYAQSNMHITEQLPYSTIRIAASSSQGLGGTGTGFFFSFLQKGSNSDPVNVIITNKHVVNGFENIQLYFKKVKDGKPEEGPAYIVTIPNNEKTVIQHPNREIDLVAIPTNWIYTELTKKNVGVYYIAADETRIAPDSILKKELKPIEDIWMIGYPIGLWDVNNNFPIVRKGITATSPYVNYNGKNEFLIDVAAFPGSSGSPIVYYRDLYTDKNYVPRIGTKLYLLGILYAGPQYAIDGTIIKVKRNPIEIRDSSKVATNIPVNLGYVIKASEIMEFKKILFR